MTRGFFIGWRQVASAFVLLAAISMIASSYGVLAVPLQREFETSRAEVMLAITVVAAVSGILAPFVGTLMDRFSVRLMMLLGALCLALGYAAISFATSFTQVLAIFGLLMAPANVLMGPMAATVLLSRWFVKQRGRALGIAIAGVGMGGVVFPPLIQWLLDSYEWREAMRVYALILLLVTGPAAALVIGSPAEKGLNPDGGEAVGTAARQTAGQPKISVAAIVTDPAFWMIVLLFTIVLGGAKGMVTNLAPLAIDEGIRPSDAALLISLHAGSGIVSKLAFAAVADRISPRILTLLGFAGFALGMALISQASSGYLVLSIGVATAGLFGGLMVPLKSFLAPRIFGQTVVGKAMGLMATVSLIAGLAIPPLFGLVHDLTGSYSSVSLAFAMMAAAAMVLVPYIRMHPRGMAPAAA